MKLGLAFSGGKDSLACLLLHKDQLHNITVFWADTGKTYPETLEVVNYAKSISPNFVHVIVDRDGQNDYWGLPADVVPIEWTRDGQALTCKKPFMIQSYMQCCYENIAEMVNNAAKAHGVTHIISGQRNDESRKGTTKHGEVFDGLVYLQPIADWTKNEVLDFISKHIELPKHFNLGHTSLDCFDCTAYQKDTKDVSLYREKNHPELHKQYLARKEKLDSAIREALEI
jgi:3'-phosphoadenosine 5'-phosphosulfate sulfotransferase (PAPS reductase)/FAD synthetase